MKLYNYSSCTFVWPRVDLYPTVCAVLAGCSASLVSAHCVEDETESLHYRECVNMSAKNCGELTLAEVIREREAKAEQGSWTPACGGMEVPFLTRSGRALLYCYQASTGRHAYLDVGADLILSDEEARLALGTY